MANYKQWWQGLSNFLSKFNRPKAPSPILLNKIAPDQSWEEIEQIISQAAKNRCLVQMYYNSTLRYVEPYSYRTKSTGIKLYAYCYKDHSIEMYTPDKIQYAALTTVPFTPRWDIEIV
jgi:predicted DNA-binding transcriptional regulator YafY